MNFALTRAVYVAGCRFTLSPCPLPLHCSHIYTPFFFFFFSTRISRLPFAVNATLNHSIILFVFREDPRDVKTLAQLIKAYSCVNPKKAEQYP